MVVVGLATVRSCSSRSSSMLTFLFPLPSYFLNLVDVNFKSKEKAKWWWKKMLHVLVTKKIKKDKK